jgi:transcriptional regulator with XRE-family HTH domain
MISGDLLREARLRARLSQAELGRRAGKATSVIGRWERNEVEPSLETLRALIRACGLELEVALRAREESTDDAIDANLALSPAERLAQVERTAELILEARRSLVK